MTELDNSTQLRKSRLLGVIFLIYAIAIPILIALMTTMNSIPTQEVSIFEWVLLIMMPIDLVIVLTLYIRFKQTSRIPFMGKTILLYTIGVAPAIYSSILLFLNSFLKNYGIILGMSCSLVSIGIVIISSPNMLSQRN